MEITSDILILVAALVILAAVGWLELRYIKSKRSGQAEAALIQDDAYNAVATTKAVAESLRQQGRDTTEAEVILYQAESAYQRREYTDAKAIAERARSALRHAPLRELVTCPVLQPVAEEAPVDVPVEVPESSTGPTEVPSVAAKKLPANYLESKFIIESAHCMLESAPEERRAPAALLLADARDRFDQADYTGALRLALRAKKALEGAEVKPAESVTEAAPVDTPADETTIAADDACQRCGAQMDPEDQFCHACGGRRAAVCPSCSAEVKEGDQFCRGCGARL